MKKKKVQDDAFSDEVEMTIEQAKVILDCIMEQQRDKEREEEYLSDYCNNNCF